MFRFKCSCCDKWHEGMPGFSSDAPLYYYSIPEHERDRRCTLDTNTCIVDEQYFFARGCLEIPVHGETEPFIWGVWVSLSKQSFDTFSASLDMAKRAHLRDGVRPWIELEPTDHPLAVEQRNGISVERVAEIYAHYEHGHGRA